MTLERSKIRLNIVEELEAAAPPRANMNGRVSMPVAGSHSMGLNDDEEVKQPHEYPYTSFVEQSGLLVVISYSGFCCKYSIDL